MLIHFTLNPPRCNRGPGLLTCGIVRTMDTQQAPVADEVVP